MEIKTATFVISNTDIARCPQDGLPEYAFIGRSNVGKSSLINMLTRNSKLALTSSTPGKTMLINHFLINGQWYLVDLPGYGYAQRGEKDRIRIQKLIERYILEREQMTNLFLLIDCRHAPLAIDMKFIEWLGENEIPFSIVFTKADKLGIQQLKANIKNYLDKLSEQWEEFPPYFITSAEKGIGRDEILGYIAQINKNLKEG